MKQRFLNLFLLFIWLSVALGLLFRDAYLSDEYRTPEWKRRLDLAMIGAFVLVAWNLVRYSSQRSRDRFREWEDGEGIRHRTTTQSKPNPKVVNPEFDFSSPDRPTEPPLNGKKPH